METSIKASKQTIKDFLKGGAEQLFVIPEYQRPYEWDEDHVKVLFDDLWEFTVTSGGSNKTGYYFLGSIVSYINENGEQEIIDGQQRITSLLLLLRAIYSKLKSIPERDRTDEVKHSIGEIEPTIWITDKLNGKADFSKILLTSRVLNNEGNKILRSILETGYTKAKAKDNYSKNYRFFVEMIDEFSKKNAPQIYNFIYAVLNQAILLPIVADTQDTALTIFSTLNDRGKPLTDADIFKAKIYNHLNEEEKKVFIDQWKELEEQATEVGESIQQLFTYNMFYYRALEKDSDTTTPGVRKYYSEKNFERLYKPTLMNTLLNALNLWKVVNGRQEIEDEPWSKNIKIKQTLDTLKLYPNEFWKYPVVVYYLTYRKENTFENDFHHFLDKLLAVLMIRCIVGESRRDSVRVATIKLNSAIVDSHIPTFEFGNENLDDLKSLILDPNLKSKVVRMILLTLAYERDDQTELLPEKWEVEHIFPRKYESNYFPEEPKEYVNEMIEHIGNKLPIEKKLNINAGNGFFVKKKNDYKKSQIIITSEMGKNDINDWSLDNIITRDECVSDTIVSVLNRWNNEYLKSRENLTVEKEEPSEKQLELIREFKSKGWV